MSFSNDYLLNVDIKKRTAIGTPTFRQGDNAKLRFRIFDNNILYDLTGFTKAEVIHELPSGERLISNAVLNSKNEIEYDYATGLEFKEEGFVKVLLSIYANRSVVSIQPFNIYIYDSMRSDSLSYIGILQELINNVQYLEVQVNQSLTEVNNKLSDLNILSNDVISAENIRNTSELTRVSNENTRISNESNRTNYEITRISNENTRISAENKRITDENTRNNAETLRQVAYSDAKDVIDNAVSVGVFNISTQYKKNNRVLNNGSTWVAKIDTQNNPLPALPTYENTWWILEAQRGVDGNGAVSSVNGVSPDINGDVSLGVNDVPNLQHELDKIAILQQDISKLDKSVEEISINVKKFGVKGDGITDDYDAIQNIINSSIRGSKLIFPSGKYLLSKGIIVPSGITIEGVDSGNNVSNHNAEFVGEDSALTIVTLDGGAGSQSTTIKNIGINRKNENIPLGSVGLLVKNTDHALIEDVFVYRNEVGVKILGQLAINLQRVNTTKITSTHLWIEDTYELTATNCRFGRNGNNDLSCNEYVRIKNTGDTINFIRCQFNQSQNMVIRAIHFDNYVSPNGIIGFNSCHIENFYSALVSGDGVLSLMRLSFEQCSISAPTAESNIFVLPNSGITETMLVGNPSISGAITFDSQKNITVVGNRLVGNTIINGCSGVFSNNTLGSDIIMFGDCEGLVVSGNAFTAGSNIVNSATGKFSVYGNTTSSVENNNTLVNSFSGKYLKLGDSTEFSVSDFYGNCDESGNAYITHNINQLQTKILSCQAFSKGNSGEAKGMVLNAIDGSTIYLNGGLANSKYRAIVIYRKEVDSNW